MKTPFYKSKKRIEQDLARNAEYDKEHGYSKEAKYEQKQEVADAAGRSAFKKYKSPAEKHCTPMKKYGSPMKMGGHAIQKHMGSALHMATGSSVEPAAVEKRDLMKYNPVVDRSVGLSASAPDPSKNLSTSISSTKPIAPAKPKNKKVARIKDAASSSDATRKLNRGSKSADRKQASLKRKAARITQAETLGNTRKAERLKKRAKNKMKRIANK